MITLAMLVGPGRGPQLRIALGSAFAFVDRHSFVVWDAEQKEPYIRDCLEKSGPTRGYYGSRFDEARNMAIRAPALDGQVGVTIMLDTDEILLGDPERWGHFNWEWDQPGYYLVDCGGYGQARVFVGPIQGHWHGRTHEAFVGGKCLGDIPSKILRIEEQAPKTLADFQAKAERDLPLLEDQIREEPLDGRWHFYLGETYTLLGKNGFAVRAYARCAELRETSPVLADREQGAWACFKAARAIMSEGFIEDDYQEAIMCLALGMMIYPGMPELPWFAAYLAHRCERPTREIQAFARMAIAIGAVEGRMNTEERIGFRETVAWFEGPYQLMALSGADGFAERAEVAARMRARFEAK
jgi:hypothetical protein